MTRTLVRGLLTGLLLAVPAARAEPSPLSPAAGWAAAYLLNAAVLAEYEAVTGALAPADRPAALTSHAGQALWRRAVFAHASLAAKRQAVPSAGRLGAVLAAHAKLLEHQPGFVSLVTSLKRAAAGDAGGDPEAVAGFAAVAASFATDPMRRLWLRLAGVYALPSPACPVDAEAVRAFGAHQQKILDRQRAGQGAAPDPMPQVPNPATLLAPIADWTLGKVQCLAFALMAAAAGDKAAGPEPVYLMTALQQTGSPLARDVSLKALTAVRLMQLGRYPETLGLIMDLTDVEEGFRLPYAAVQRVFSLMQRGEGQVALQGL